MKKKGPLISIEPSCLLNCIEGCATTVHGLYTLLPITLPSFITFRVRNSNRNGDSNIIKEIYQHFIESCREGFHPSN